MKEIVANYKRDFGESADVKLRLSGLCSLFNARHDKMWLYTINTGMKQMATHGVKTRIRTFVRTMTSTHLTWAGKWARI